MEIVYTYEIAKVDAESKTMEILYTSENRPQVLVGAKMPYEDESLEEIVKSYAPLHFWWEQGKTVKSIEVGTTGIQQSIPTSMLNLSTLSLESAKINKLTRLSVERYIYEISGITLNGIQIQTDRTTQATVSAAFISLSQGLATSIDWKTGSGQWIAIGLPEITAIAQAVVSHVQNAFSLEKTLSDQVNAATTIEEVESIIWPQ